MTAGERAVILSEPGGFFLITASLPPRLVCFLPRGASQQNLLNPHHYAEPNPESNNHFYAPHPFSLMGAFAEQLEANRLIEDVVRRSVRSAARFKNRAADATHVRPHGGDRYAFCCQIRLRLAERGKRSKLFFLSSCHSIQTMEHEFYECPEYLSNTAAAVERTEEYEYEVKFHGRRDGRGAACVPSFLSSESPEINVLHGNNLLPAEKRKIHINEVFNCGFGFSSLSNIGTAVPLPLK